MTKADDFTMLMDLIRATFTLYSERRISKFERTRQLKEHQTKAATMRAREKSYIQGYIAGRLAAQDETL